MHKVIGGWKNRLTKSFVILALSCCCHGVFAPLKAAAQSNVVSSTGLGLNDFLQQVLRRNELMQAQFLAGAANHYKAKGEYGIFEPRLDFDVTRDSNQRTNTTQQQAAQSGDAYFSEHNNIYDAGLVQLVPTGGKVRIGYTLSDLKNNVNPYGSLVVQTNGAFFREYQTFAGVSFEQPLLKNAGMAPTMVNIRLAVLESRVSFQEYRRQVMLALFQAETAYWDLYFAQEQIRFYDDSVALAQTVLDDSKERMQSGQGAELDVLEAQSGLALRQTKRNEAMQTYYDAVGRVFTLTGTAPPANFQPDILQLRAIDAPTNTSQSPDYWDCLQHAMRLNPDYLAQVEKVSQAEVRRGFAKNQLLPDLSFKAAYGLNGLGQTPKESWEIVESERLPSWSVGLMLDVPLLGNMKGRNDYIASRLNVDEAQQRLSAVQTEIANGLSTAIQKYHGWEQIIPSYQTVVHYNEELLKTESERLKAGRVEARKVLEVEADLLNSRQEMANAMTQYRRALMQVDLTEGALLERHNVEITHEAFQEQTRQWLANPRRPLAQPAASPPVSN